VTVPGADLEAFVAAKQAVPDERAELLRNGAGMFDGQIGQTTAGIQDVGLGEGLGGAGIQTTGAGAAVIGIGGVGGDGEIGQEKSQQQPGSVFPMDEQGVFPLPTDAGKGGEGFFKERGAVDTDAVGSLPSGEGFAGQGLQFFAEELVVVRTLGVGGDPAAAKRWGDLAAGDACHENGAGGGVVAIWIGAGFWIALHPVHFSLKGAGEPRVEVLGVGGSAGGRDAEGVEAESSGGVAKDFGGV